MTALPGSDGASTVGRDAVTAWHFGPARRFLAARIISLVGDSLLPAALLIWTKDLTQSNASVGVAATVTGVTALSSLGSGWVVDRAPVKRLLLGSYVLSAAALLPLLLVGTPALAWIIYLVMFTIGVIHSVHNPSNAVAMRVLIPRASLSRVNWWLYSARSGMRIVAPLIGAAVYTAAGIRPLVVVDAVSFLVPVALMGSLPLSRPGGPSPPAFELREATRGIELILGTPVLRAALVALGGVMFVLGGLEVLMFALIGEGLGRPPEFFGLLSAVYGGAAVIGGAMAPRLCRRLGGLGSVSLAIVAVACGFALYSTGRLPLVLAGQVANGLALPVVVGGALTISMIVPPEALQGRVSAAFDAATMLAGTASPLIAAALVVIVDYRAVLAAGAVLLLGVAAVTAAAARADVPDRAL